MKKLKQTPTPPIDYEETPEVDIQDIDQLLDGLYVDLQELDGFDPPYPIDEK